MSAVLPEPGAQPQIAARRAAMFPTVLRPSRRRLAASVAGSLCFVAIGLWMTRAGGTNYFLGLPLPPWVNLVIMSFFGLCAVIFAVLLLPGAAYLKIGEKGFTVCSLFRQRFRPWEAVEGFGVTQIVVRKFVGVAFTPAGKQAARITRLNNRLVGFDDMLPDTYGRTAEELAALLNDALALAPRRPPTG